MMVQEAVDEFVARAAVAGYAEVERTLKSLLMARGELLAQMHHFREAGNAAGEKIMAGFVDQMNSLIIPWEECSRQLKGRAATADNGLTSPSKPDKRLRRIIEKVG